MHRSAPRPSPQARPRFALFTAFRGRRSALRTRSEKHDEPLQSNVMRWGSESLCDIAKGSAPRESPQFDFHPSLLFFTLQYTYTSTPTLPKHFTTTQPSTMDKVSCDRILFAHRYLALTFFGSPRAPQIKQVFSHDSADKHASTTHGSSTDAPTRSNVSETSPSSGVASSTTPSSTTGTSATHGTHESLGDKIREHAHPPAHQHKQPTQDGLLNENDAKAAVHDHQHLAPVTHETHQRHEVEEVERQREVDRHGTPSSSSRPCSDFQSLTYTVRPRLPI